MAEQQNLEPEHTEPDPASGGVEPEPAAPAPSTGMTPGQRLAAKKASKSVKKQELKEEFKKQEAEAQAEAQARTNAAESEPALPEGVQQVARDFSDFAHEYQGRILGAIAAFVLIAAAVLLGQRYLNTGNAKAAAALAAAIETANAQVDAANKGGKTADGKPAFSSREGRAKKSIEAFASVAKKFDGDPVVAWAQLGEASAQVELGAYDKAQRTYEAAYAGGKSDPAIAARALEGLGIALEARAKRAEALKRYEALQALPGDYNKARGQYHVARLKLASGDRGDREAAKKLLKEVYDRLSQLPEGEPESKYLKSEVEIRLGEIDSSLVDKGTSSSGQSFSKEDIERLMKQMKEQGGLPGGAAE